MTRRLPNCAACGQPLRQAKARRVLEWQDLPGRPMVGWCECDEYNDPIWARLRDGEQPFDLERTELEAIIAEIEARGPDRVMRTMPSRPTPCAACGVYPADPPSRYCAGCEAYQEHQWT